MVDDRVLAGFAVLLEETTGLRTPESNRNHLKRVINRETRAREVAPARLLSACRRDEHLLQEIVDAAMIGETYFFREVAHFRYLRSVVLPSFAPVRRKISAWSASCSSGEEAVSLAAILDQFRRTGTFDTVAVYASDIRSDMVDRIRRGIYPLSSLRRDGDEFHDLLRRFYVSHMDERSMTISRELRDLIRPATINLFSDPLDQVPDDLDVVFFRNTLIYAPAENRQTIIDRIVQKLRPGGYLFLANSELPFVRHPELVVEEGDGAYCLRRVGARADHVVVPDLQPPPRERSNVTDRAGIAPPTLIELLQVIDSIDLPGAFDDIDFRQAAESVLMMFSDLDKGRLDRAATYLDTISVLVPDSTIAHYCAGWYYYITGATDEALDAFAEALRCDDSVWPAHFYRGKLEEMQA
ncbi:MAG: hypothetical protein PF508_19005, partial [Spirochaeta sp.]|nr:hypothetical protein [Spirochaeta sp.]